MESRTDEQKANLFADRLLKTFTDDCNPRFDVKNKEKIDKYFDTDQIENDYSQSAKNTKLFTRKDIDKAIKDMNSKTSIDMAGHSNKMLKNLTNSAQNMILDLFNECLKKIRFQKNGEPQI